MRSDPIRATLLCSIPRDAAIVPLLEAGRSSCKSSKVLRKHLIESM